MTITLTLNPSAGADLDNFNLYSDTDNFTTKFNGVPVTRAQLLAGYNVEVPAGTTVVRVQPTGACTNHFDASIDFKNAPVAFNSTLDVLENSASNNVALLASDIDGDVLTYNIVTVPSNGTLYAPGDVGLVTALSAGYTYVGTVGVDPEFIYVPNADYFGEDSFTFSASDADQTSNVATVGIVVQAENDKPIITSTPTAFNGSVGDNYSYNIAYTDPDNLAYEVTLTFTVRVNGVIDNTGWTLVDNNESNNNGTATLSGPINGVTVEIDITAQDPLGLTDSQNFTLSAGIAVTENSYFRFVFDDSGSMNSTLDNLERELKGNNIGAINDYTDSRYLRYYLQDFYATAGTEASGNNNPATNGRNEYNAKVSLVSVTGTTKVIDNVTYETVGLYPDLGASLAGLSENIPRILNNGGLGFGEDQFPGATSVVIALFLDEADSINVGLSSFYDPSSDTLYDFAINDVKNLNESIKTLNSDPNKGEDFYRGIFFPVEYYTSNTVSKFWNAAITNGLRDNDNTFYGIQDISQNVSASIDFDSNSPTYSVLQDNSSTVGYYTEKVVNALIDLGYAIIPYGTVK